MKNPKCTLLALKPTHSIRAASLLPILKNTEILCQVLYWKLACPSALFYPPEPSLVTAVKMIGLCSVIFRWQSWPINRMLPSSGAFTKRDGRPADGPEDGAGTIPSCSIMVYAWSTTARVSLAVLPCPCCTQPRSGAMENMDCSQGLQRVPSAASPWSPLQQRGYGIWDLVGLCVCKPLVMILALWKSLAVWNIALWNL